jgi:hypothetical protein
VEWLAEFLDPAHGPLVLWLVCLTIIGLIAMAPDDDGPAMP